MSKNEIQDLEMVSRGEFDRRVARARELLAEIHKQLPGLKNLTSRERLASIGKLKLEESSFLGIVLDAIDDSPHYFSSLANRDGGVDSARFETPLLRDQLARRDELHGFAEDVASLSMRVSDTVMYLGSRVRKPVLEAYKIGRLVAMTDGRLRQKLAPAIDYYARPAKRAAGTRAKKKQSSAAAR